MELRRCGQWTNEEIRGLFGRSKEIERSFCGSTSVAALVVGSAVLVVGVLVVVVWLGVFVSCFCLCLVVVVSCLFTLYTAVMSFEIRPFDARLTPVP